MYEEFARNIPGFSASPQDHTFQQQNTPAAQPHQVLGEEAQEMYHRMMQVIESHVRLVHQLSGNGPHVTTMQKVLEQIMSARTHRDPQNNMLLITKITESLLELTPGCVNPPLELEVVHGIREVYIVLLKESLTALGRAWVLKTITQVLTSRPDDSRFNLDAVEGLIKNSLINVPQYDMYLSQVSTTQ